MDSNENEEHEAPKEEGSIPSEDLVDKKEETKRSSDLGDPVVVLEIKKTLAWIRSTLQEEEGHIAPHGSFRESKRSKRYYGYHVLMTNLIDYEHSTCE